MGLPDAVELYGEQEEIVAITGEEDAPFSSGEAELLVVCVSLSRDLVDANHIEADVFLAISAASGGKSSSRRNLKPYWTPEHPVG